MLGEYNLRNINEWAWASLCEESPSSVPLKERQGSVSSDRVEDSVLLCQQAWGQMSLCGAQTPEQEDDTM